MTIETLIRANKLTETIQDLQDWKELVCERQCFKLLKPLLPESVIQSGVDAMVATIDEQIDSLQKEMDSL